MKKEILNRCFWVKLNNPTYVAYHDNEWGKPEFDDTKLFEALFLETFQAGLSWEIILNKRENFRKAFNNFDSKKIATYTDSKIDDLLKNDGIIRNRLKIVATVNNAKIFIEIQKEFESFSKYIWGFTNGKTIIENELPLKTKSPLSDKISKDLKKRGMKFLGSTTIYSYLQAVGIINAHEKNCYLAPTKRR